ncbi:MAG TPA: hypothetical protein DER09_08150 [Prolixibacteraceae bacterium]|nr:hypothetical protein [Prolixibacteraceae bacterium]
MENKYKEGSTICAIVNPTQKLLIRRYVAKIYYCKIQEDLTHKELVFFERELMHCPDEKSDNQLV